jgi:hypothetical protein
MDNVANEHFDISLKFLIIGGTPFVFLFLFFCLQVDFWLTLIGQIPGVASRAWCTNSFTRLVRRLITLILSIPYHWNHLICFDFLYIRSQTTQLQNDWYNFDPRPFAFSKSKNKRRSLSEQVWSSVHASSRSAANSSNVQFGIRLDKNDSGIVSVSDCFIPRMRK